MVVVLWKIGEMLLRERVGVVGGDLSGGDEVEGDLGGDELRWGSFLVSWSLTFVVFDLFFLLLVGLRQPVSLCVG